MIDVYTLQKGGFILRIAVIDDLERDARQLADQVSTYMSTHRIPADTPELFPGGEEFLAGFMPGVYDIIFLDIYMNGINGMETARKIRLWDTSCHIIFVTTSSDFAVDSYEVKAMYYLIKPTTEEQVSKALDRCNLQMMMNEASILVPAKNMEIRLLLHQISYTEYLNRRVLVHLKDGRQEEIFMNQKDFAALLLSYPWLCDCMKGILVNFEEVDKLLDDRFVLKNGTSIPISRLKYQDVREQYIRYSYDLVRGGQLV